MSKIKQEQKETLREHIEEFKKWLKTPKGQANLKEHRDHEKYLQKSHTF